jgi:hypothetical protein
MVHWQSESGFDVDATSGREGTFKIQRRRNPTTISLLTQVDAADSIGCTGYPCCFWCQWPGPGERSAAHPHQGRSNPRPHQAQGPHAAAAATRTALGSGMELSKCKATQVRSRRRRRRCKPTSRAGQWTTVEFPTLPTKEMVQVRRSGPVIHACTRSPHTHRARLRWPLRPFRLRSVLSKRTAKLPFALTCRPDTLGEPEP